jgi:hypothetical protein
MTFKKKYLSDKILDRSELCELTRQIYYLGHGINWI